MKINSIPSFKANFKDVQFYRRVNDEALNTERMDEFIDAKETISNYMPYGTISRYSYNDRDVYKVIPREPLEITIPKNIKSPSRHLDSLIALGKIIKQISSDNNQ